jgi:hypothetical protein
MDAILYLGRLPDVVTPEAAAGTGGWILQSLQVSKYAVTLGVLAAVADASLQGIAMRLELHCCPRGPGGSRECGHWRTGRTAKAFVYAGTAGIVASVVRMVFYDSLPIPVILPQVIPCELLLLPFQFVVWDGEEDHLTRNVPHYLLLYTLINLVVYVPIAVISQFWELEVLQLVALSIQQMWIGFSALGLLLFFNRYHEWQRRIPLPPDPSRALRWSNPALINAAHFFGNLSVVFLTTEVVLKRSSVFPFLPTLPLWFAQILVNTQMQLIEEGDIRPVVKMIRMASVLLALPACNLKVEDYFPTLSTLANVLAFSAFSLWIGTFNEEWRQLFDDIEGPPPREPPEWAIDRMCDFRFLTEGPGAGDPPAAMAEAPPPTTTTVVPEDSAAVPPKVPDPPPTSPAPP